MAFPKIAVKVTNVTLSPGLQTLIDQKFSSLSKFVPDTATDATCKIEVEKLTEHQSGKIYRVEINLFMFGRTYRAEAMEEHVEKAIDVVRDELRVELQSTEGKRQSMIRRGARIVKDFLRFG